MTRTVAIIGRPNVGKSTLFNRLVGQRLALVDDTPGLTRDRREGEGRLGDLSFTVIDTAGLEEAAGQTLEARMRAQTERAIRDADVCLFLIDARAGVTPLDHHFADLLRKAASKVIVIANKCESAAGESGYYEAFSLGLGEPIRFSAEHAHGLGDLHEALSEALAAVPAEENGEGLAEPPDGERPLRIAIVGRPNVGKSTLVNTLLGTQRVLVGPEAGVTRDAIAVDWIWQGRLIKLFDTAGVRRRARIADRLEKLSVGDTLRAIRFAEVVIVLIDSEHPFDKQDLQIVDHVVREGRALILAINKWDLVKDKNARLNELKEQVARLLPQVAGVPLLTLSATTGKGVERIMPAVERVYEDWNAKVKTPDLNQWLAEMAERHPPPAVRGRRIRLRYMAQTKSRPPTFVLFASRAEHLPESYRRYLINGLRRSFGLTGVPIRLHVRKGRNPYAPQA